AIAAKQAHKPQGQSGLGQGLLNEAFVLAVPSNSALSKNRPDQCSDDGARHAALASLDQDGR
ncbi:MAG TPA: hypothetical protein V6D46_10460, partial [Coleofasciculaceae cyanobacterium]